MPRAASATNLATTTRSRLYRVCHVNDLPCFNQGIVGQHLATAATQGEPVPMSSSVSGDAPATIKQWLLTRHLILSQVGVAQE